MIRKKLRNRGGFTLAETLLAVTILLLVSAIVATGMPAAKNAYEKVVLASNAEVLLSTAASALRDELGTAWNVESRTGGGVTYFSASTGTRTELFIDGTIKVKEYAGATQLDKLLGTNSDKNKQSDAERDLVFASQSDAVKLSVTASSIVLKTENGKPVVAVDGLSVNKQGADDPLATMSLTIPVFSAVIPTTP